jgi:Ca2+-transporting ATPase
MRLQGLSDFVVLEQRNIYGENLLPEKEPVTWFKTALSQFKSPLIYILLFVIALSLIFREVEDTLLVSAVVILNVVMGFIQEYGAQKTLRSLKKVVKNTTTVVRNGQRQTIDTKELVPKDLVLLGSGDRIPADGHVLEGSIFVSEAILTGEEESVQKNDLGKTSQIFMGTVVLSGRCTAIVEKTGLQTEVGKIGISLLEIKERQTPLQIKLEKFSRNLALLVAIIGLGIFLIGIFDNHDLWEMVRFSIILSIAAIPEGLPITITVILSIGMKRVLKHKGLVNKLLSIETLGSTSVICTDKTGTLTEGIMRVVNVDTQNQNKLLYGLAVLNTRRTSLEIATWDYLKKTLSIDPQIVIDKAKILYEEIFESEKKYAFSQVQNGKSTESYILGAPEIILKFCKNSSQEKIKITKQFLQWTKQGLRVVGLITKTGDNKDKSGFSWVGLIGINDPIRPGVKEAIQKARAAGIIVKIVTGDFRNTAEKVADSIGLRVSEASVMEGQQLEKITLDELKSVINKVDLFCRVSPHQKLKIITALQENGEIVAMTGDGVNDAPALKRADIGVVVGSATDVAKDSGDLILLDNNFKTIVAACEEGRIIYQNIIKAVGYVLSNSLAEIVLIVGAMIMNIPFPLTIVQILWLHLICDGPPDIALGFEPGNENLMKEKPTKDKGAILSWSMVFLIFTISLSAGIISLLIFIQQLKLGDLDFARTTVFAIIGSIDLVYIFAYKDLTRTIVDLKKLFNNKILLLSVVYGFTILLFGIYHPYIQRILHTVSLPPSTWLIIITIALLITGWVEIVKKFRKTQRSVL